MDYKTLNASNATDADISAMVNEQLKSVDDKGKLQLPDDMPDWQKHVVRGEKRQRDAQSALGKANDKLRASDATLQVLKDKQLVLPSNLGLTQDEVAEINGLATTDPEQYRLRMNAAETNARKVAQEELDSGVTKSIEEANNSHMTNNRVTVLQNFRDANPELVITDDVLVNDVPPRFMKKLNDGEYANYGEYLEAVKGYIINGTEIPEGNKGEQHNLHDMSGKGAPGKKSGDNQKITDLSKVSL
jgi:hypothetical protein